MAKKCEICDRQTDFFESVDYGDKCIFHCDKSDEAKWGSPESEDVKRFWRAIRQQIDSDKIQDNPAHYFNKYHFPAFEKSKIIESDKTTYLDDKNFGLDIYKKANFYNATFYYDAFFGLVTFHDDVLFENIELKKSLILEASIFSKSLTIKPKQPCDLKFYKSVFKENSRIFIDGTFNSLCIDTILNDSSSVKFNDVTVVKELSMRNFLASNFEFNGFHLKDEAVFYLEKVSLKDVYLTEVEWGDINENRFRKSKKEPLNRQTARQFKHINDTQGENVIANEFYALEMKLHSKELEWKWGQIGEKIVQNIHGLISNYSNDWALPTIWFFAFGFLFATLAKDIVLGSFIGIPFLLGLIFAISYAANLTSKKYFAIVGIGLIYNYFFFWLSGASPELLAALANPLNFKDSKDLLKDTNLVLIYVCRIIELFIGYQIITAIRKNTRRK